MSALRTLALLLLAACAQPSREAVEAAGAIRRATPGAADALAARPFDCGMADRACVTLWAARGAACARVGEEACAREAFRRAAALMPVDATEDERAEVALRLADAEERGRDRATGAARRAANAAILDALAPLRGAPAAAHYAAGVALNRVQSGDVPAPARCAALRDAAAEAAQAADMPGLPPRGPRLAARRAAIAAQLATGCPSP
jgi:hypothetical protein